MIESLFDRISILTWNVRYFGHGLRGLRSTNNWIDKIASCIANLEQLPDVLALQEVESFSLRAGSKDRAQHEVFQTLLNQALKASGIEKRYELFYFPAHRYGLGSKFALYTTGLAFLVCSDLRVVEENSERPENITEIAGSGMGTLKQTRIVARLLVETRRKAQLEIFNTHLSLPTFRQVGVHRIASSMGQGLNQLAEINRLCRFTAPSSLASAYLHQSGHQPHSEPQLPSPPRAQLLVGDLNSEPSSPVYEHLLQDGWRDLTHESDHRLNTAGFMHLRMHIDHAFFRGEGSGEVEVHDIDARDPFFKLSDHSPKMVSLDLAILGKV